MTRNEKIALGIGAGVVVFGGLAIYFSATSKPSASPSATPPTTPPAPQQFAPTTTPTPTPQPQVELAPNGLPVSWNAFTSVVAGHKYLVTLTSSTPLQWWRIVNPNDLWGGFRNPLGYGQPTQTQYQYTIESTETHPVQNIEFLLGVKAPVAISVVDLGAV